MCLFTGLLSPSSLGPVETERQRRGGNPGQHHSRATYRIDRSNQGRTADPGESETPAGTTVDDRNGALGLRDFQRAQQRSPLPRSCLPDRPGTGSRCSQDTLIPEHQPSLLILSAGFRFPWWYWVAPRVTITYFSHHRSSAYRCCRGPSQRPVAKPY